MASGRPLRDASSEIARKPARALSEAPNDLHGKVNAGARHTAPDEAAKATRCTDLLRLEYLRNHTSGQSDGFDYWERVGTTPARYATWIASRQRSQPAASALHGVSFIRSSVPINRLYTPLSWTRVQGEHGDCGTTWEGVHPEA